eukprot:13254193-Alexandrium_andersonii.AAC.1
MRQLRAAKVAVAADRRAVQRRRPCRSNGLRTTSCPPLVKRGRRGLLALSRAGARGRDPLQGKVALRPRSRREARGLHGFRGVEELDGPPRHANATTARVAQGRVHQ